MGLEGKITPPACVWIIPLYFNTNCETPLMTKALVTSWNNRKCASLALLHGKEQEFWWQGRMNFTLPHFCSHVCSLLPWHKKGETCQGSCLQTQGRRRLRGCFADRVSLPPKTSHHTDIRSEWVDMSRHKIWMLYVLPRKPAWETAFPFPSPSNVFLHTCRFEGEFS